jgi:hypothetical protein
MVRVFFKMVELIHATVLAELTWSAREYSALPKLWQGKNKAKLLSTPIILIFVRATRDEASAERIHSVQQKALKITYLTTLIFF